MDSRQTITDLLSRLNSDNDLEKKASAPASDEVVELMAGIKEKMTEDKSTNRLIKRASDVADTFSEKIAVALEASLGADAFVEKVAARVLEGLAKLAIESSGEVVHMGTDTVEKKDPKESVEDEAATKGPKVDMAEAAKQDKLNKELVEGAAVSGPVISAEKKAMVEAFLDIINE